MTIAPAAFIDAGDLHNRIKLQSPSQTIDTFGQPSNTSWSDVASVWASIQALSGRELFAAQANQSEVTHEIIFRYQSMFADPKTVSAMRIVFKGRYFNIHSSVNEGERNVYIRVLASESLNDG